VGRATGGQIPPAEEDGPDIRDSIVQLSRNYRFGRESGIAAVSDAVNRGEALVAEASLKEGYYKDITWADLPRPEMLRHALRKGILGEYQGAVQATDPHEVFQHFERFRILCALREGPYGVRAVNKMIEDMLKEEEWIKPEGRWYRGQPVMITRNDHQLKLYNGDMGVILQDVPRGKDLKAFFQTPEGTLRKVHPGRLPEHETVYAMTVHKSQGSEFDRVLLLLPDRESPVLTRELLYTGMTRAKKSVEIWGRAPVFEQAVSKRTQRASGLHDLLWDRGIEQPEPQGSEVTGQ
jgi:exodeoxyribonuclease V alpha subunit